MALELRDLRYFLVVAEERQVTRAAARLHVSQPTLSEAMERLERHVGAALFVRHAGGVSLTAAGEVLIAKAAVALTAVDAAVDAVRAVTPASLTVGFVAPVHDASAAAVAALHSGDLAVEVRWVALDHRSALSALRAGTIDVAFVWSPAKEAALAFAPVVTEQPAVLLARDHELAAEPVVSFEAIREATQPSIRATLLDPCHLTGRSRSAREGRGPALPSLEDVWALIASHEAVAIAPASVARRYARAGVVHRPVTDMPQAVLAVAWRSDDRRPEPLALVALASSIRISR